MIGRLVTLVLLALLWAAVVGSFDWLTMALGVVLGVVALFLVRGLLGRDSFRAFHPLKVLRLGLIFLWELFMSCVRVARDVLRPRLSFTPGIVAVPLDVDRDAEIVLFANLITLTPGTMSLDVSDDKSTLYIHQMSVDDPQAARDSVKGTFEKVIMEALR